MRITFVMPGYCSKPTGGAKVVYQYANNLVIRDHNVSIVHPLYMKNVKRTFRGIIKDILSPILTRIRIKRKWVEIDPRVKMLYVRELKPSNIPDADVVLATAWETAEYVIQYPASKGRKYYLIQHYEIWSGLKERVDATWRMPFKKIVIAQWLYNKGVQLGASKDELFYVPNGIDHKIFRIIKPIEARSKRIGMMYYDVEWKGSKDGITALEMLHDDNPGFSAVIFGRTKRPAFIPDWIEYRFLPSTSELVEGIYNECSIYISPSWAEGSPAPPAEAMACGCALAATDCSGIDECAEDGVTALLSPIKDPVAMSRNLKRLLNDDELRIRIAKNGSDFIKSFTWEDAVNKAEQLFKRELKK